MSFILCVSSRRSYLLSVLNRVWHVKFVCERHSSLQCTCRWLILPWGSHTRLIKDVIVNSVQLRLTQDHWQNEDKGWAVVWASAQIGTRSKGAAGWAGPSFVWIILKSLVRPKWEYGQHITLLAKLFCGVIIPQSQFLTFRRQFPLCTFICNLTF